LLNNLAYVTWITTLPLLLAKMAHEDTSFFAQEQSIATSLVSAGFILASFLGTYLTNWYNLLKIMI
jgi:hypothetical protein